MHSKGHSIYYCCAFLIARKTAINYLLKAGDQRSEMTLKNYPLFLIELGVLRALKGLLFLVGTFLLKIRNEISTCLKFM